MRPVRSLSTCLLAAAALAACASPARDRGAVSVQRWMFPDFLAVEGEEAKPPSPEPAKTPVTAPVAAQEPPPPPPKQPVPPETADPAAPSPRRGPYAGVALLFGFEDFDTPGSAGDGDLGLGLRFGSRLDDRIAVEGFLELANGFEVGRRPNRGDVDLLSIGAQGKYFLGTDPVRAYLLGGVGFVHADVSRGGDRSGLLARVGLGGEIPVGEEISAFAELRYDEVVGGARRYDHADLLFGILVDF